jgi:hypothetical protein
LKSRGERKGHHPYDYSRSLKGGWLKDTFRHSFQLKWQMATHQWQRPPRVHKTPSPFGGSPPTRRKLDELRPVPNLGCFVDPLSTLPRARTPRIGGIPNASNLANEYRARTDGNVGRVA